MTEIIEKNKFDIYIEKLNKKKEASKLYYQEKVKKVPIPEEEKYYRLQLKETEKLYYEAHKEIIKLKNEILNLNNNKKIEDEKIKQYRKEYRENNKEKIKETKKKYRENNKEKIKEARKKYNESKKIKPVEINE